VQPNRWFFRGSIDESTHLIVLRRPVEPAVRFRHYIYPGN
jgi:hypothetical protein